MLPSWPETSLPLLFSTVLGILGLRDHTTGHSRFHTSWGHLTARAMRSVWQAPTPSGIKLYALEQGLGLHSQGCLCGQLLRNDNATPTRGFSDRCPSCPGTQHCTMCPQPEASHTPDTHTALTCCKHRL